jgi:hypothetical protein
MIKPFITCRILDIRYSRCTLFLEAGSAASRRRRIYFGLDSTDTDFC